LPSVERDIGLLTHFANSDVFDDAMTTHQIERFERALTQVEGERSLSNSAGILGWPEAQAQWVRAGGALYGISVVAGKIGADFGFRPAMTLTTRLIAINRVRKGEHVGYAATYECPEDMNVGIAAIGYGDGYPRHADGGTPVLVNGARANLIGRVSMDLVTIDLRNHPDARIGDPVVLWGRGLPVEEVAMHADTIGYELTCGVTRRVRFVEDES
jgi:alanine racemase